MENVSSFISLTKSTALANKTIEGESLDPCSMKLSLDRAWGRCQNTTTQWKNWGGRLAHGVQVLNPPNPLESRNVCLVIMLCFGGGDHVFLPLVPLLSTMPTRHQRLKTSNNGDVLVVPSQAKWWCPTHMGLGKAPNNSVNLATKSRGKKRIESHKDCGCPPSFTWKERQGCRGMAERLFVQEQFESWVLVFELSLYFWITSGQTWA